MVREKIASVVMVALASLLVCGCAHQAGTARRSTPPAEPPRVYALRALAPRQAAVLLTEAGEGQGESRDARLMIDN